jgi:hypothetical protein
MLHRCDIDMSDCGFIGEQLELGLTLSHLLLNHLMEGVAYAMMPERYSEVTCYQIMYGATFTPAEGSEARTFAVNEIVDFLRSDLRNVCVMENAIAKPSDPFIEKKGLVCTAYGDEVYYAVTQDKANYNEVEKTRRFAGNYPFFACMTSHDERVSMPAPGQDFSLETLQHLASRARRLVIGAFDDEAFVYWERDRQ